MNNKTLFLFLSTLTAGILLGYAGDSLLSGKKSDAAAPVAAPDKKSPDEKKNNFSESPASQNKLDRKIREYARMNRAEIEKELQRWNDGITSPAALHSRDRFLIEYLCQRWGDEAPRQALLKLLNMPHLREIALLPMMKGWAEKNPESLTAYCLEQGGKDNLPDDAARFCTYTLAQLSPEKSVAWMKTLPQEKKDMQIHYLLSAIQDTFPEKISTVAALLGEDAMKSPEISAAIASAWGMRNWEEAAPWINSLPEETRTNAWSSLVKSLPPEEALKKLDLFDEKTQNGILAQKTYSLFSHSPQKALDWLTSQVTPERAAQIIDDRGLFIEAKTYTPEFKATLDKLPAGPVKDSMLARVVSMRLTPTVESNVQNNRMEDNLALAAGIANEEKKAAVIELAMRSWILHRNEAKQARQWLEQSALPQAQKEQYLQWCASKLEREKE